MLEAQDSIEKLMASSDSVQQAGSQQDRAQGPRGRAKGRLAAGFASKQAPRAYANLMSTHPRTQALDATTNEAWGPHGQLLMELAGASYNQ